MTTQFSSLSNDDFAAAGTEFFEELHARIAASSNPMKGPAEYLTGKAHQLLNKVLEYAVENGEASAPPQQRSGGDPKTP